jgi:hypothetical protein
MFDYDSIAEWGPQLERELHDLVPSNVKAAIAKGTYGYMEDARDPLLEMLGDSN